MRLATVGLGPLLLAQGLWARRRTPRLPEPPGPRAGVSGAGPLVRVLILGDSAAAGVGAPHQDQALSGHLARGLARRFETSWQLEARTGARTADAITRVRALQTSRFDYVVTSLGVNDVVASTTLPSWRAQQRELREVVRSSLGAPVQIISGLPPVWGFPALPQPLRWYLGRRARQFDRALAADVAMESDAVFLPLDFALDASLMATDGFHPGPEIYRQWADRLGAVICSDARSQPGFR
jgi:lysophospholipase L1-like esterase